MRKNNIRLETSEGSLISSEYDSIVEINGIDYYAIKLISVNQSLFRFSERSGVVIDDLCCAKLYCIDASEISATTCLRWSKNSIRKPGFFYIKKSDVIECK